MGFPTGFLCELFYVFVLSPASGGVRTFCNLEPPLLLAKEAFSLCSDPWLVDFAASGFCRDVGIHGCR